MRLKSCVAYRPPFLYQEGGKASLKEKRLGFQGLIPRRSHLRGTIRNFQNRLIERGHSAAILRKYLSAVKSADRKTALQQRNKSARKKLLPRPLLHNTTLLYQA